MEGIGSYYFDFVECVCWICFIDGGGFSEINFDRLLDIKKNILGKFS